MAIYSTFFVCQPEDLPGGFPGWKLPLRQPVRREVRNPFTGEMMTIKTTAPEWPDVEEAEITQQEYKVVRGSGKYEDYLESRIPSIVREHPHWCAKNITEVELGALGEAAGILMSFEQPLFAPPSTGAILQLISPELCQVIAKLDPSGVESLANAWASILSTPEYTHSVAGDRISDDPTSEETLSMLKPIAALVQQMSGDQQLYLFTG